MSHKTAFISSIASLEILLGMPSGAAMAQMSHQSMQPHTADRTGQFHQIDQPLWVKATVTTGGLGLIGLELWWFLFRRPNDTR